MRDHESAITQAGQQHERMQMLQSVRQPKRSSDQVPVLSTGEVLIMRFERVGTFSQESHRATCFRRDRGSIIEGCFNSKDDQGQPLFNNVNNAKTLQQRRATRSPQRHQERRVAEIKERSKDAFSEGAKD
jgi:hypothetical protein